MPNKKPSDFRYNTGETKVPWAAVGENYTAADVAELVSFLIQKKDDEYDKGLDMVTKGLTQMALHGTYPGKLSLGENVSRLESEVSRYLGAPSCAFITNATAGFEIGLKYANIGPGDEVIVPAITFAATMAYTLGCGAKVVFADVDERTINMDPADVERKITSKTKAIIPVHIGGRPVDMDPIMDLAEKHDLVVIEDAAHAFGAVYKGKMAGTIGHFGSFSFHEVKNITSFGEGGIVTCSLPFGKDLAKARFLGLDMSKQIPNWLYDVAALEGKYGPFAAGNSSSTEIQALGLLCQLKRIDAIIEERRRNALYLTKRFAGNSSIIPQLLDSEEITSTHHLYLLQINPENTGGDIQILKQKLTERGVTNIPHFAPLYHFDIVKKLGYSKDREAEKCPNAEEAFQHRFTHLPLYGLSREQLEYMADAVLDGVEEMKK